MLASEYIFTADGITTRICSVADGILRITRTRRDHFLEQTGPAAVLTGAQPVEVTEEAPAKAKMAAPATSPEDAGAASPAAPANVLIDAGPIQIRVEGRLRTLSFYDADGKLLLKEPHRRQILLEERPVYLSRFESFDETEEVLEGGEVHSYVKPAETWLDRTAYEAKQSFVFDADEALYGLGAHEEGYGNLRGRYQTLYQQNKKAVVPVLVSTKGWGILMDCGSIMSFHDDPWGSYFWVELCDELDWYLMYGGGSYEGLMAKYRALTGEAPMVPRFALGFMQSKERYVSQAELLEVAGEYRRRGVPLDVIIQDWMTWPGQEWGWKTFDRSRFPDPEGLTRTLHDENVKIMVSVWPNMTGSENADRKEMLEQGFILGDGTHYDAFDPAARALYWQQAKRGYWDYGIDGWWCDCTEPFEGNWGGKIRKEPIYQGAIFASESKRYLDPTKTGLYSLHHSQGIYEGQRGDTDEKRVLNLTRSSWAGQHRNGAYNWSGDTGSSWELLKRHIPEGLNFTATGEALWNCDIGGFFPAGETGEWFRDGEYEAGVADLGFRELCVRWWQYGALLPMMRAHGTDTPREIWRYGEPGTPFYDAIEKAIRLRYHLIPFYYTLLAEYNRAGVPMTRIPALVFPEDARLRGIDHELMLGDVLLAKPVTRPMYYERESEPIEELDASYSVYLPAGHSWYAVDTVHMTGTEGFEDVKCYAGGQEIEIQAPLEVLPLFARSGAILPWGADGVQCTEDLVGAPLTILIYAGEDGHFTLYDDAGQGYGYERGEASCVAFDWEDARGVLHIGERKGSYPGMPETLALTVRVMGGNGRVKEVVYAGKAVEVEM